MENRKLVTGKYVNDNCYVLYDEEGKIFKTIIENKPFNIGNDIRPWIPKKIFSENSVKIRFWM